MSQLEGVWQTDTIFKRGNIITPYRETRPEWSPEPMAGQGDRDQNLVLVVYGDKIGLEAFHDRRHKERGQQGGRWQLVLVGNVDTKSHIGHFGTWKVSCLCNLLEQIGVEAIESAVIVGYNFQTMSPDRFLKLDVVVFNIRAEFLAMALTRTIPGINEQNNG